MNVQEYIASGILETYSLGGLSATESAEVETYAKQYPEIRTELDKLEDQLEDMAVTYAKEPPASLKSKIASDLAFIEPKEQNEKTTSIPFYRWAMAASVALAVVSVSSTVYFWNKWQEAEGRVLSLQSEKTLLSDNINLTTHKLNEANDYLTLIQDSNSVVITLKGSELSPKANAKVLWNKATQEVYLGGLNALPSPSADQQYQLWAIVDGKPVDAGVFDFENESIIQHLKKIGNAQAFAVTLEKKGGSPAPTLSALYLIGNV